MIEMLRQQCLVAVNHYPAPLASQYIAAIATHFAQQELQKHGLTTDYVDLIYEVAEDLDEGNGNKARLVQQIALRAIDRIDPVASHWTETDGDWYHAVADPNYDPTQYRHLRGIIESVDTRKVFHVINKNDGGEPIDCNVWAFVHDERNEETGEIKSYVTSFFDFIHKGVPESPGGGGGGGGYTPFNPTPTPTGSTPPPPTPTPTLATKPPSPTEYIVPTEKPPVTVDPQRTPDPAPPVVVTPAPTAAPTAVKTNAPTAVPATPAPTKYVPAPEATPPSGGASLPDNTDQQNANDI